MKRRYEATIIIEDTYSDSKDPVEAKEFPINTIKEFIENELLSDNGLEIIEVKGLKKL